MKRHLLTAMVMILALSGCTSGAGGQVAPTSPPDPPTNPDRDIAAVVSALSKLDACALVPGEAISASGVQATPTGPYSCVVDAKDRSTQLTVTVGGKIGHLDLAMSTPVPATGVRAYQRLADAGISGGRSACEIIMPTSFDTAIRVELATAETDSCAPLVPMVRAAVPRINGSAAVLHVAKRPGAPWAGCVLLGELLGADLPHYRLEIEGLPGSALAGCSAYPVDLRDGHMIEYGLTYGFWDPLHPATVAGRPADRDDGRDGECGLSWNMGPSGVSDDSHDTVVGQLSGLDCGRMQAMATKAISLLGTAPPVVQAPPLGTLTYGLDQPDEEVQGACVNLMINSATGCAPAVPAQVPSDTNAALNSTDYNVTCAAFQDGVHAAFGPQYQPVTWGQHCFFVTGNHPIEIQTNLTPTDGAGKYGDDPDVYSDRKELTVGGHPAVEFYDRTHTAYDVYVAPGTDLNGPGNIHIGIKSDPPRGVQVTGDEPRLSAQQCAAAKRAIEQTVVAHFH